MVRAVTRQAIGQTIEKNGSERLFHGPDSTAERRLGQAQLRGSPGKAAQSGYCHERIQLGLINGHLMREGYGGVCSLCIGRSGRATLAFMSD